MRLAFTLLKSTRLPAGACRPGDLGALAEFVLCAERVAGPAELTLDLTHPRRMQSLNRRFRGVDRPTDVISFRYHRAPALHGDIAINVPQAKEQSRRLGHSLRREIRLLWIHGILHLLGYTDYQPARHRQMFKRQSALLRRWENKRA
jgi:probable rRNA maturation factor